MSEPNPYESPKTDQPLNPAQVVKRGIGVVTILLLTPVAVLIALCGGCLAAPTATDAARMMGITLSDNVHFALQLSIFASLPLLAMIGMLLWAVRTYRRR